MTEEAGLRSMSRSNNRYSKKDSRILMIAVLGLVLAALVLLLPKEPVVKAVNAVGDGSSTASGLYFSEIMTDNASALPDENGAFGDWLEVWNSTEHPIPMKNVGISNRSDKIQFLFPEMTLEPNGRVIVFCDKVNRDDPAGTLHAKCKLSSLGVSLFLFDQNGVGIDQVTVPTLNADESYQRMTPHEWRKTDEYAPGYEKTFEGHTEYLANFHVDADTLMFNEIMPVPKSGLRDEDGELSDWIELYNAGNATIRLNDVALSDNEQKPLKWFFPEGAVIEPGQYYIVFCSGKNKMQSNGIPHTNFKLSGEGETLVLTSKAGELIDRITVPNIGKDVSYAKNPGSSIWSIFQVATPGRPNTHQGVSDADRFMRQMNESHVYITEVLASSDVVTPATGEPACDWVELYNDSNSPYDLSLCGLSDNIGWPRKWQFPMGTTIYPGEYKIIRCDKSANSGTGQNPHTSFGITKAGGEVITLSDSQGRVLDKLYIPQMRTDVSYGRSLETNGFFYYDTPTPGQKNSTGFAGYAETPVLSLGGGLYESIVIVTIDVPEGTTVRYTTNGAIPTLENSEEYSVPLAFQNTTVLRARAFQPGLQPSDTVSASYVIGTYFSLPVVSVIIDPDELYNEKTGIFTAGPNVDKSRGIPFRNTIYRQFGKIPRPAYIEVFEQNGAGTVISQGIKVAIGGDYSLDMPQKTLKIRAQAKYGEKYFEYPLFDDRPFTFYKSFNLRNSGNDCVWTRLSDGFQSQLIDLLDTDIIHLAFKPVIVFINGEFYGHYNMRERKDRFCIAQWEGLDMELADQITILRASYSTVQGSNKEYRALLDRVKASSPGRNAADLKYITDNVDVDSYFDYLAIEMFFGNSDIGNTMFYKLPGPGQKWKWLIFDLDYGMFSSSFNSPKSYTKPKGMGDKLINNTIFLKLLENEQMKQKFLERLAYVYRTLTPDVMNAKLNQIKAILEPVMPMHFERWAPLNDKKINSDSPRSKDGAIGYWNTRINRMRDTINRRHHFLWGYIKEAFSLSNPQMLELFGAQPEDPLAKKK